MIQRHWRALQNARREGKSFDNPFAKTLSKRKIFTGTAGTVNYDKRTLCVTCEVEEAQRVC